MQIRAPCTYTTRIARRLVQYLHCDMFWWPVPDSPWLIAKPRKFKDRLLKDTMNDITVITQIELNCQKHWISLPETVARCNQNLNLSITYNYHSQIYVFQAKSNGQCTVLTFLGNHKSVNHACALRLYIVLPHFCSIVGGFCKPIRERADGGFCTAMQCFLPQSTMLSVQMQKYLMYYLFASDIFLHLKKAIFVETLTFIASHHGMHCFTSFAPKTSK